MSKISEAIITGIIGIIVLKLSQKGYVLFNVSEWIGMVLHLSPQDVVQKVSAAVIAIASMIVVSVFNKAIPSFKIDFYISNNEKIVNLKAFGNRINYKTEGFKIRIQVNNNKVSNVVFKWLNAAITIIITPDTYTLSENYEFDSIKPQDTITQKIDHGYIIPIQHFHPSDSEVSVEIPLIAMGMYQGSGRIEVSIKGNNKLEDWFLHVYCKIEKSNFEIRSISNE